MDLQEYNAKLLELIAKQAEVMDFQDLYYLTFEKQATPELISSYVKAIKPVEDDDEDYEESYSYEESYDEDDD